MRNKQSTDTNMKMNHMLELSDEDFKAVIIKKNFNTQLLILLKQMQ